MSGREHQKLCSKSKYSTKDHFDAKSFEAKKPCTFMPLKTNYSWRFIRFVKPQLSFDITWHDRCRRFETARASHASIDYNFGIPGRPQNPLRCSGWSTHSESSVPHFSQMCGVYSAHRHAMHSEATHLATLVDSVVWHHFSLASCSFSIMTVPPGAGEVNLYRFHFIGGSRVMQEHTEETYWNRKIISCIIYLAAKNLSKGGGMQL